MTDHSVLKCIVCDHVATARWQAHAALSMREHLAAVHGLTVNDEFLLWAYCRMKVARDAEAIAAL